MTLQIKQPFAIVLMPFHPDFTLVYETIIRACADAGVVCERVDQQVFNQNIVEQVHKQIKGADLVIAELTGKNPNVYYETGYASALEKPIILLTQDAEIPFNLKQYPHIIYSREDLAKLRKSAVEHINQRLVTPNADLTIKGNVPVHMICKATAKSLDLPGGTMVDGACIQQWSFHGEENQTWRLHPVRANVYRIVCCSSGKCLSVQGDSSEDGAPIVQWDYHGTESQHWILRQLKDESYQIENAHTGKCLDVNYGAVKNGAPVVQYACHGGDNQRWWFLTSVRFA